MSDTPDLSKLTPSEQEAFAKGQSGEITITPKTAPPPEWTKGVPEKFHRKTPEETIAALTQSYTELEKMVSTKTPTPPAEPPKEPVKDPPNLNIPKKPEAPPEGGSLTPEDWIAITNASLSEDGKIPDELQAKLKAAKIPDEVVQSHIDGTKARVKLMALEAANLVGGNDQLQSILTWAAENISESERASINQQLKMPGWQNTLLGIQARMAKQQAIAGQTTASPTKPLYEPTVTSGGGGLQPFSSLGDMQAAMRDPRYNKDPHYTQEVMQRVALAKQRKTL